MTENIIHINGCEVHLIPLGTCMCGCGGKTPIAKKTQRDQQRFQGQPCRFIKQHHHIGKSSWNKGIPMPSGDKHWHWQGGGRTHKDGYRFSYDPNHPRSCRNYILEHILIAEKVIGKPLPPKAEIHHVNENPSDNTNSNLVICQDRAYHKLLHRRTRAFKACGHASWRMCEYCRQYDDPKNMYEKSNHIHHRECRRLFMRKKKNSIK